VAGGGGPIESPSRRRIYIGDEPVAARIRVLSLLIALDSATAFAHPGAGIAVDLRGQIYFTDTGAGVWKVDRQGRLTRHPGQAVHWMAIDTRGDFSQRDMPPDIAGHLSVVGPDPSLIQSSDFPIAVGRDGTLFYPRADGDRVKIMRVPPGGSPAVLASLPPIREVGPEGNSKNVPWITGLAAGPGGSLYYAERDAVRKISTEGSVSLVAGNVTVPDCTPPPALEDSRIGPGLRGLDVMPDGTIYVAASGCKALLKISPRGVVEVALGAEAAWTPTGVAISGDDVYVLEYWYPKSERREDWIPRVRKLSRDGNVTVIASVRRD
jgi:hypothetical protein